MIWILLTIWMISSISGCALSALIMRNARRDMRYLRDSNEPINAIDLHLATAVTRRESLKFAAFVLLVLVGLSFLMGKVEIRQREAEVAFPILLAAFSVLLATSTVLSYIDDRTLRDEIREEVHGG